MKAFWTKELEGLFVDTYQGPCRPHIKCMVKKSSPREYSGVKIFYKFVLSIINNI